MSIAEKLNWSIAAKSKTNSESKEETYEEEDSNLPFPGAAPLFTKASGFNWGQDQALSEPRPCYPGEDPVEDHCNPNISPDTNDNDSYVDDYDEGSPGGGFDWDDEPEWDEEGFSVIDPGYDPLGEEDEDEDDDEEWSPEKWEEEIEKDMPELPETQEEEVPEAPKDTSRQAPPTPRDPGLGPDEPHQFWQRGEDYIQEVLPQLKERAQKGDPEARRLLHEGPRVGRYDKQSMFDKMQDPKFWEKKGSQKYRQQIEKEEGLEPGSLGPMSEEELQKIRDLHYSDDKGGPVV